MAHTDCARWLNGRGRGARWDNSLTTSDPYVHLPPLLFGLFALLVKECIGAEEDRLPFPGNCRDKTGPGTSRFSSDYKDFLARSFETQTYVYEQAVSTSSHYQYILRHYMVMVNGRGLMGITVRVDHVDLEDRGGARMVAHVGYPGRLDPHAHRLQTTRVSRAAPVLILPASAVVKGKCS